MIDKNQPHWYCVANDGITASQKATRVICTSSEEIMVHHPNGRVEFVGPLALLKLIWGITRSGGDIVVVDGAK